ncbi:MAG: ATP-dependent DNA helicase UvrD2 [Actinomycetota bacterium]
MKRDELLAGLNDAQVRAVTEPGGPIVVLAGAGSGKTRVLTRRIAWRVADDQCDPTRVLALTFTRKAAGELRQRLVAVGLRDRVPSGTFHAIALLQLRQRWADRGIDPPRLVQGKGKLLSPLVPRSSAVRVGDVAAEIDWARARMVEPEHYGAAAVAAGRTPPLPPEAMAEIMTAYAMRKRRQRVVDFDDLLALAVRDLRADPGYAEAIRWRFRHLYVDEFQDVNPLQAALLALWRGDRDDLFVVGDPNQAIYGWNGADPDLLDNFAAREPTATVIELQENYRSTPQILAVASTLSRSAPLVPQRGDGPVPTITAHPDDRAEANAIARRVRDAHSVAGAWADQAVLVRTNAQLLVISEAFREAAVPIRLRGSGGPLATAEVRAERERLERPEVDVAAALSELEQRLDDRPDQTTVAEIERLANLRAFVRLVHDYLALDAAPSGLGLRDWLATLDPSDLDEDDDAVELATFHGAKGLEWPVVHVAGLEEGFVPIAYATTGAQLAEEQRLLYVALTRAEDELHLTWAAERTFTTNPVGRNPSPLLSVVGEAKRRLGVGPAQRVDWRRHLVESRAALDAALVPAGSGSGSGAGAAPVRGRRGRPGTAPRRTGGGRRGDGADVLYEALVEWRRRRARAADVPAHAVFNDRTLRAIAEARPTTKAKLAAIGGIGPTKLERFGPELLRLIADTPLPQGR